MLCGNIGYLNVEPAVALRHDDRMPDPDRREPVTQDRDGFVLRGDDELGNFIVGCVWMAIADRVIANFDHVVIAPSGEPDRRGSGLALLGCGMSRLVAGQASAPIDRRACGPDENTDQDQAPIHGAGGQQGLFRPGEVPGLQPGLATHREYD